MLTLLLGAGGPGLKRLFPLVFAPGNLRAGPERLRLSREGLPGGPGADRQHLTIRPDRICVRPGPVRISEAPQRTTPRRSPPRGQALQRLLG